jgi:tetratricopeptide (TPR) repeat protein
VGGEIGVGSYKLRLVSDEARVATPDARITEAWPVPPVVSGPRPSAVMTPPVIERPDLPLRAEPVRQPAPQARGAARPASSRNRLIGAAAVIVSVGAIAWFGTRTPREAAQPPSQAAPPVVQQPTVQAAPTVPAAVDVPSKPLPVGRAEQGHVVRKPGETIEAWRAREIACQTRYAYSREALDRGDFAAAAGGFEAILRDEPGFLDVPALLVKARAGLREAALEIFQAAQRLEAAGDWAGALQKYEQAGQIQADLPGLPEAIRRMREKVRGDLDGAQHPLVWPIWAKAGPVEVDCPSAARAGLTN